MAVEITELPDWLDFDNWNFKGIRLAPKFQLHDDVRATVVPKNSVATVADSIGRGGVQYFRTNSGEYPVVNSMHWYESKEIGPENSNFYNGESQPPSYWANAANAQPIYGTVINEFLEGGFNVRQESEQYRAWARTLWEKYVSASIQNPEIYISYGAFVMYGCRAWQDTNGGQHLPSDSLFTSRYDSQQAARNAFPDFFQDYGGGYSHDKFNLPCLKFYTETPLTADAYYMRMHELEIICKAMGPGARCAYVSSGLIEQLGSSTQPGANPTHQDILIAHRTTSPPGLVTCIGHPDWSWQQQLAMYFGAIAGRGKRIISWADTSRFGEDPNKLLRIDDPNSAYKLTFTPDTPGQAGNYPDDKKQAYPIERLNWIDSIYSALHKYRALYRTAGGTWQYAQYKIGNGSFTTLQSNGSDICFAATTKTGVARVQQVGNDVSWEYYNPNLLPDKDHYEQVTIKVPSGQQFTVELQGGTHHSGTYTV